MLMLDESMDLSGLIPHLGNAGIRVNGHRWVFHLDVSKDDSDHIVASCSSFAGG